jgi:hypothetical protein
MSDEASYLPKNQERDSLYNREPGISIVPGSNFAREVAKFEQFPTIYTAGDQPGNPYAYRPYPKMLYRAEHWKGKAVCMASPPNSREFYDEQEFTRAEEAARAFTERCQMIVGNESERSKAFENGWREHPEEAVAYLLGRDKEISTQTAHRHFEDKNMSELAQREIAAAEEAHDGHLPEIPEQRRRRGRPRKNTLEP